MTTTETRKEKAERASRRAKLRHSVSPKERALRLVTAELLKGVSYALVQLSALPSESYDRPSPVEIESNLEPLFAKVRRHHITQKQLRKKLTMTLGPANELVLNPPMREALSSSMSESFFRQYRRFILEYPRGRAQRQIVR